MKVSWGPVIWLAAALVETLMFYGYPQLFGAHVLTLVTHLGVAALYSAFWLAIRQQKRKKPR
jgi:hypothetical protein